jgi:hypothetical protein
VTPSKEKGEFNGNKTILTALAGTGILGVVIAGAMSVASDASIAIKVAEQHGEELLMIRGEMSSIRQELNNRTSDRYTGKEGARFEQYVNKRLDALEKQLDRLDQELKKR